MHDAPTRPGLPSEESDPRPGPTIVVSVVGVALLSAILLLLEVLHWRATASEVLRKSTSEVPLELRTLLAAQREQLSQYRWVDATGGIVALPIERAMELVAGEASRGRPPEEPEP